MQAERHRRLFVHDAESLLVLAARAVADAVFVAVDTGIHWGIALGCAVLFGSAGRCRPLGARGPEVDPLP